MLGVSIAVTGLAIGDDESPLEKQMSEVNKKNTAIRKVTKTVATWKKDGKNVAADAERISELAKEAKKDKTAAEKVQKSQTDWEKFSDGMIKAADDLAAVSKKPDSTHAEAKSAFGALQKSCTECHAVFRVEDDK